MKVAENYFIVKKLLENDKACRDNDTRLILRIWLNELPSQLRTDEVKALFKRLSEDKYSKPESITRCRRKCQEDVEQLRGAKYKKRQEEQENVKRELGYPENNQTNLFD